MPAPTRGADAPVVSAAVHCAWCAQAVVVHLPVCVHDGVPGVSTSVLQTLVQERLRVDASTYYLTHQGRSLPGDGCLAVPPASTAGLLNIDLYARARLEGGKGGFGSLLRALGAKQATIRTTNFDACRDLHGRRLRNVQDEESLQNWEEKRKIMLKEAEEQKHARLVKAARVKKHKFEDEEDYGKALRENIEKTEAAVHAALKRKTANDTNKSATPRKRVRRLRGDSDESEEESDDAQEDEEADTPTAGSSGHATDQELAGPSTIDQSNTATDADQPSPGTTQNTRVPLDDKPAADAASAPTVDNEKDAEEGKGDGEVEPRLVDLGAYQTLEHMIEGETPQSIKLSLLHRGLKCGGRPEDRASRLWGIKNLDPADYPAKWKAKKH